MKRRSASRSRVWFRRFVRVCEIALFLLLTGGFFFKFYEFARASDRFQVRTVEIEGIERLDEARVLKSSGVTLADNVMFFDAESTRRRVEALPLVKRCSVSLTFPDTVVLRIEERDPIASLMLHSRSYAIDDECVVLWEFESDELPMEPYLTNVGDLSVVEVGERLDRPELTAALEVWRAFSGLEAAKSLRVSEIAAWEEDDIRMYIDEVPFEIRWGRGTFGKQARRFELLWRAKGPILECFEYLDLRFEENLICK